MNTKKKQILSRVGGLILLTVLVILIYYNNSKSDKDTYSSSERTGIVEVHFIDVGQGDAILIEADNHAMLVDAGENYAERVVIDYLEANHISRLDYVIGTHPHSDHIGGLDGVLNRYPTDRLFLPSVTHTTKTFENLLDAIEDNQLNITRPDMGQAYSFGPATFTFVAPNSDEYEEMNDYSIGIKLTYGSTSFLLLGDAGKASEQEMLKNHYDLSADVLKLSHHGSSDSNSEPFLDAVDPTYAVISLGKDNDYGHPHAETMKEMMEREIKVYRTDQQGTIIFASDGKNISVNKENYLITEEDIK